ncbi:uncharacterized protein [Spinacia oleracea]|uniref:Integrase zinc-binding domain-containing protein n=1 Tax=Spinacia oleracea TaxID=3562 RepID=A0ABM3R889_SPIOL|nr:uncharacterized protein LOC130467362 [Spinacia oleracea]
MERLSLELVEGEVFEDMLSILTIQPTIFDEIKENKVGDVMLDRIKKKILQRQELIFKIHEDGRLRYKGRWCVPKKCEGLNQKLMEEGRNTPYSVHLGGDKLYKDLKKVYWVPRRNNEVDEFVSRRLTCQKVKIEHIRPQGKVQPLEIPSWKCDCISMDFLAKSYIKYVVRLHGVPNRDSRFLSKFWKSVQENFGTTLKMSKTFHPEKNGQT